MARQMAVIGAGLMGHGIAYLFAQGGWQVRVQDANPATLASLLERISHICALLHTDAEAISDRISLRHDIASAVRDVELVIEAAPEIVTLKQQIFAELERCCARDAILASNTSVIPMHGIAEQVKQRQRVAGSAFLESTAPAAPGRSGDDE